MEVTVLRDKGERLNKKLEQAAAHKYHKKPKTSVLPDQLRKLTDSLLALKLFGGVVKTEIPLEIPEDETKIDELELIFNKEHEEIKNPNYEKEAADLLKRYHTELTRQKIAELTNQLADLDEDDPSYESIIREISNLQKTQK